MQARYIKTYLMLKKEIKLKIKQIKKKSNLKKEIKLKKNLS